MAENSAARGKTRSVKVAASALPLLLGISASGFAAELPTQGQVVAGQANITQGGRALTVQQGSDKLAIDWQSFSIGQGYSVNFVQPSAQAVALNRVLGSDVSVIQGALNANGQVFLVNPNGVTFTPTARVNTGALVASTLNLKTEDFLAGNYRFEGDSSSAIVNQGRIQAAAGGSIALIAARISNAGQLEAPSGQVLLGAGRKVVLDLGGPVKLHVEEGAIDALIDNGGAIRADGGLVYLSARAAGELATTVINTTGLIEAQTLANGAQGQIVLLGGMDKDQIRVAGRLDASAPQGGNGGFIETSAAGVKVAPDVQVDTRATGGKTGQWLIDPYDVLIAASGGDITGATIAAALGTTNLTIDTTEGSGNAPVAGVGNITVNDAITKTGNSATTLTLKAHNNVNVNQAIKSTGGRLNVVLTADQDNSGAGDVNFGANGSVVTNGGNFHVGSVASSNYSDQLSASGQKLNMTTGSYVDVGFGTVDVKVKGNIQLADNSAASGDAPTYSFTKSRLVSPENLRYWNNGTAQYAGQVGGSANGISLASTGGSIISGSTSAGVADIVTAGSVMLSANGQIGTSTRPIKIQGSEKAGWNHQPEGDNYRLPNYQQTLSISNTLGASHVSEINKQIFGTIDIVVGASTAGAQDVQIMAAANGVGRRQVVAQANGGTLSVAGGGIDTRGAKRSDDTDADSGNDYSLSPSAATAAVFPVSVRLNAPTVVLADEAVKTDTISYKPTPTSSYYTSASASVSISANAIGVAAGSAMNGTREVTAPTVTLSATDIGTATAAPELNAGSLVIYSNGGNTFLRNTDYGSLTFESAGAALGEHHVYTSSDQFFNVRTDGTGLIVDGISAPTAENPWGSGIATFANSYRNVTVSARDGAIVFDDNAVNLANGTLTASLLYGNSANEAGRVIRAKNLYDPAQPAAQITAGSVNLNVHSPSAAGSIGGNGYDLQIAKGSVAGQQDQLQITTYGGDVKLHELSENHFKTIRTVLNGANTAQTLAYDLAGADDVKFSDSGSLLSLDAAKVNIGSYNRNWELQAQSRVVRLGDMSAGGPSANSLGTGYYRVYANRLQLDGDVLTNGGDLFLSASRLDLMRSLRIDSNADDMGNSASTGSAGYIYLQGTLSGTQPGYSLTVDSGSSTTGGNMIQLSSNASDTAGAYLSGLALTTKGSTDTNDGALYFYGSSYYLNGNFSAVGNTYLNYALTIDTEQGNTGDAGSITFGGSNLSTPYWSSVTLNAATTAAGKNGGLIDLYGTYFHSALRSTSFNLDASAGAGGTAGDIRLPEVSTLHISGSGTQSYNGRVIELHGNLLTQQSAITLTGEVRLASDVTIDTWTGTNNAASGNAGSVTINGGLSADAAGRKLSIDTSTDTGTGYANAPTDTQAWAHSSGAVSITAGAESGTALDSLQVTATKGGLHNDGAQGSITLSGVHTSGAQTYTGGALNVNGAVSASMLTVNTVGSGYTVGGNGVITAEALLLNGQDTIYALASGTGHKVATLAATGARDLSFLNDDVALTIGTVGGVDGVSATGQVAIATQVADLRLAKGITTSNASDAAVVLNAGQAAAAGTAAGGNLLVDAEATISTGSDGRTTLYTGSVTGSTGVATLVGEGSGRFRYNSDESNAGFTTALGTGLHAIYREQPTIGVTAQADSKTYDGQTYLGGAGALRSGFANGDTDAALTGELSYGGSAYGAVHAGSYTISLGGLANGLGYAIAYHDSVLEVSKAALVVTANDAAKTYDGQAYSGGSGVRYDGLVQGDTAAALGGALSYGGSAQGAVRAGSYTLTASGLSSNDYAISYQPGTLTVDKATLVVTANDAAKTYDGQAFSGGNGVRYAGLVEGDTAAALGGTLSYGGSAQGAVRAGSYAITASGLSANDYAISYQPGMLTVGKAALVVTANDAAKTYDGQAYSGGNGVRYAGLVEGDTAAALGGALSYGGSAQGAVRAGSYAITTSGLSANDYAISYQPGTLTVDKATLVVTANDAAKTYDGQAFSGGNGVRYAGLVEGDTAAALGGALSYGGSAQGAVRAGSYAITASGLSANDYAISYQPGMLTVGKATLVVTANDAAKTYDGQAYSGGNGVRYAGLVEGDTAAALGGALSYGGSAQGAVHAGSYAITASGLSANDYAISYQPGTLTLDKAALTVTANDASKHYDGLPFSGGSGVSYTGLVSGDTPAVLGGQLVFGGDSQNATNLGRYALQVSGLSSNDYAISFVDGTLTILQPLTPLTTAIQVAHNVTVPSAPPSPMSGLAIIDVGNQPGSTSTDASSSPQPSLPAPSTGSPAGGLKLFVLQGGIQTSRAGKLDAQQ